MLDFTERYSLNSENVSEAALLDAFTKIEQVRADIPITYFEFGALLAIEIFSSAEVDVAVMEVGLGGSLDAINICLLYTSPSPRDLSTSRMPSSA